MLGSVYPIDPVVSAHNRPGLCFFDGDLEGGQVDLIERLFVNIRTHRHSLELLVVDRKMFQGSSDALALHPIDIGGGQLTRQDGVFGKVLEIAPAQGGPLHIHSGPEQNLYIAGLAFAAQRLADGFQQGYIPGRRQSGSRGKAGSRHTVGQVEAFRFAHAMRAVGHEDRGYAQALHRLGGPGGLAGAKGCFFLQRHLRHQGAGPGPVILGPGRSGQ